MNSHSLWDFVSAFVKDGSTQFLQTKYGPVVAGAAAIVIGLIIKWLKAHPGEKADDYFAEARTQGGGGVTS